MQRTPEKERIRRLKSAIRTTAYEAQGRTLGYVEAKALMEKAVSRYIAGLSPFDDPQMRDFYTTLMLSDQCDELEEEFVELILSRMS